MIAVLTYSYGLVIAVAGFPFWSVVSCLSDAHSGTTLGARKKGIEIDRQRLTRFRLDICKQPSQRAIVIVQHGLPVNIVEREEQIVGPGAVTSGGCLLIKIEGVGQEQGLDYKMPDVDVAEGQIPGVKSRRIVKTVFLLPGDSGVGYIARLLCPGLCSRPTECPYMYWLLLQTPLPGSRSSGVQSGMVLALMSR